VDAEAFREQVRASVDMVALVSHVTSLRKAGKDFRGLCPFHDEKTPSFYVVPSKGIFKCFGCGEGGDVFDFVMKTRKVGFKEALSELAADAGLQWAPERRALSEEQKQRRQTQQSVAAGDSVDAWQGLGISEESAAALKLGRRDGTIVIPVGRNGYAGDVPDGWLCYDVAEAGPVPRGLARMSASGLAGTLYLGAGFMLHRGTAVFVVDPAVVVKGHSRGLRNLFSTVAHERAAADSWISEEQAGALVARYGADLQRIVLAVPTRNPTDPNDGDPRRALYETELVTLQHGIECALLDLPVGEGIHGWNQLDEVCRDAPDGQPALAPGVVSVFDTRLAVLGALLARGRISVRGAEAKLVEPLRLLRGEHDMLYEAYLAWSAAMLPTLSRESLNAVVASHEGGEAF
jgi:hypothetical protein